MYVGGKDCAKLEMCAHKTKHLSSISAQVHQEKKLKYNEIEILTDSVDLLSFQGYLAFTPESSMKIFSSNRTLVGNVIYFRSTPRGTKALARIQTLWFHRVWGIFQICCFVHLTISIANKLVPRVKSVDSLKK
jgi:hypothetical protein